MNAEWVPEPTHDEIVNAALNEDALRALGLVTTNFASVELFLRLLLWTLLNLDDVRAGLLITDRMGAARLIEWNGQLAAAEFGRGSETFADIKARLDAAEEVRKERNNLVHVLWSSGSDRSELKRLRLHFNPKQSEGDALSATDLYGLADRIAQVSERLLRASNLVGRARANARSTEVEPGAPPGVEE